MTDIQMRKFIFHIMQELALLHIPQHHPDHHNILCSALEIAKDTYSISTVYSHINDCVASLGYIDSSFSYLE